jgi:hypothetical protein
MFLDETEDVTRKARGTDHSKQFDFAAPVNQSQQSPSLTPIPSLTSVDLAMLGDDFVPVQDLPQFLELEASSFFYQYFMLRSPANEAYAPLFASLSPFSPVPSIQALYHSIQALGLISLAIFRPIEGYPLASYADSQYLAAISSLSLAVRDPNDSLADATLFAVLILTVFETYTVPPTETDALTPPSSSSCKDPQVPNSAWSNHISGAAGLLEARGIAQFDSPDGIRLFLQACIPLCVNCMQAGRRVPPVIRNLITDAQRLYPDRISSAGTSTGYLPKQPPWTSFSLLVRYTDFLGAIRQREITNLIDIVTRIRDIDGAAAQMITSYADHDGPETVYDVAPRPTDTESITPLGYAHRYSSFAFAELLNGCRGMRLQLNQILRNALLIGLTQRPPLFTDADSSTLLHRTHQTLQSLSHQVIASVPQYLGYIRATTTHLNPDPYDPTTTTAGRSTSTSSSPTPTNPLSRSSNSSSSSSTPNFLWTHFAPPDPTFLGQLPLVRSASGGNVAWALFAVALVDTTSEDTQLWCGRRLLQFGRECGAAQAKALGEKVVGGEWVEGWWRGVAPRDRRGWVPREVGVREQLC